MSITELFRLFTLDIDWTLTLDSDCSPDRATCSRRAIKLTSQFNVFTRVSAAGPVRN